MDPLLALPGLITAERAWPSFLASKLFRRETAQLCSGFCSCVPYHWTPLSCSNLAVSLSMPVTGGWSQHLPVTHSAYHKQDRIVRTLQKTRTPSRVRCAFTLRLRLCFHRHLINISQWTFRAAVASGHERLDSVPDHAAWRGNLRRQRHLLSRNVVHRAHHIERLSQRNLSHIRKA